MLLKINTSITLSTGHSASAAVIQTLNDFFKLGQKSFICDIKAWKSQADKDAGKDSVFLFKDNKIISLAYTIPQGDLDQAASDGHFGVIGQNHPTRIKDEIASKLAINASDIEILSLV